MYVLRKIDLAVQKELYYRLFGDEQFPTQLTGRKFLQMYLVINICNYTEILEKIRVFLKHKNTIIQF